MTLIYVFYQIYGLVLLRRSADLSNCVECINLLPIGCVKLCMNVRHLVITQGFLTKI